MLYKTLLESQDDASKFASIQDELNYMGQIQDLAETLNTAYWFDFSQMEHQVLSRFLTSKDQEVVENFFYSAHTRYGATPSSRKQDAWPLH